MSDYHVTPVDDLQKHELTRTCWCRPKIETSDPETGIPYPEGALVVHNSADGRELVEEHGLQ